MRLIDMQLSMFDVLGYGDQPGTADVRIMNRLARHLNTAYHEIMSEKGLEKLRRQILTLTCTANSPFLALPMSATRLITLQDRVNMWPLGETTLQRLRFTDPGLTSTSAYPYEYVLLNYAAPSALDPSVASELFLKSTSTADGSGLTAYVEAVLSGGYPRNLNIALNGTTAVSLDPTVTTITNLRKFFLSAPGKGDIVLTQTSGVGTELSRIPAGRTMAKFTRVHLHPTPSQQNTYYVDVELAIEDLLVPNDEPLIPDDFCYALEARALMREYQKKEKTVQYGTEKARALDGLRNLKLHLASTSGVETGHSGRRWSQLGPNYVPGS